MNRILQHDQIRLDSARVDHYDHDVFGPVTVFKDVVIARAIVQEYEDGMAYKPGKELLDAFWTAEGRWSISGRHPDTYLIMNRDDIHGRTVNARPTKSLKDPVTKRPMDRGILVDLEVFDNRVAPQLLKDMVAGAKSEVSIGFSFDADLTPGVVDDEEDKSIIGTEYDYVQRNISIDHVAYGLDAGRCPMPFCGVGADAIRVALDPFGGFSSFEECVKSIMKENPSYTREQAEGTCGEIEKRSKEKHKKDVEVKYSMMKVTELKQKINEILSELDDLVEEEYQGNATNETLSERARRFHSISEQEWDLLSEEEKLKYIESLPPEKKRAGGEEMSTRDCTYDWNAVREKILGLSNVEPVVLSKVFADMVFEEDSVTISDEAWTQLSELGVELDDCNEAEEEVAEETVVDEVVEEKEKELPSTEDLLSDAARVWNDKERIIG